LLDWLRREGDDDKRLTPGEVRALVRDAERARDRLRERRPSTGERSRERDTAIDFYQRYLRA
jgi:hypothetical protein